MSNGSKSGIQYPNRMYSKHKRKCSFDRQYQLQRPTPGLTRHLSPSVPGSTVVPGAPNTHMRLSDDLNAHSVDITPSSFKPAGKPHETCFTLFIPMVRIFTLVPAPSPFPWWSSPRMKMTLYSYYPLLAGLPRSRFIVNLRTTITKRL